MLLLSKRPWVMEVCIQYKTWKKSNLWLNNIIALIWIGTRKTGWNGMEWTQKKAGKGWTSINVSFWKTPPIQSKIQPQWQKATRQPVFCLPFLSTFRSKSFSLGRGFRRNYSDDSDFSNFSTGYMHERSTYRNYYRNHDESLFGIYTRKRRVHGQKTYSLLLPTTRRGDHHRPNGWLLALWLINRSWMEGIPSCVYFNHNNNGRVYLWRQGNDLT